MTIIPVGVDSWMLGETVKLLMDDARDAGVYCEEAYIGITVERLRRGESHTKVVETTNKSLSGASWMRSSGDMFVFADYNAESKTLIFSRCSF